MRQGILFCTPCYGGMVTTAHLQACLNLKEELTKIGLDHDWLHGANESLIGRARCEMTRTYLETDYSHMMWLDADIDFTPEDVAKVWNLEADIGVGVYRMKSKDSWFAAWKDGKLVENLNLFEGPIAVEFAGTGFMLITREAILKVIEALEEFERKAYSLLELTLTDEQRIILETLLQFAAPQYQGPHGMTPALYMTPIWNKCLESEDYHFCRIAREAGFKVIMDPTVRLGHIGQYRYGA